MKNKQILITGHQLYEWEERVNNHLRDGWTVVPQTLELETAVIAASTGSHPTFANAYAVVLETEKYKE